MQSETTVPASSTHAAFRAQWHGSWPLERVLFAMAGTLVSISAVLAAVVSPWFLLLTAFVAINQLLYASVGYCGASLFLSRFAGLTPVNSAAKEEVR